MVRGESGCRGRAFRHRFEGRWLWSIAVPLFALAAPAAPASAHYYGDYNPWGNKRTLCYRLGEDVAQDKQWPGWIRSAVANWNKVSKKTGWTFVECKEGDKADFDFRFHEPGSDYKQGLENRDKGLAPGSVVASQTGTPLTLATTQTVKIVRDINKFKTNNQVVEGGANGWDTNDGPNNQKRLDPVLTMMHELTHTMMLDHVGGCSATDFEDPVCAGDHAARTPSLADINQIRFALGNTPIETVTPPALPEASCFATAEAKQEFLKRLKAQIDELRSKIKEANDKLSEHVKGGPPTGAALAPWAATKATLEFEIAQDSINATVLEIRYAEAEALDVCKHGSRIVNGGAPQVGMVSPGPSLTGEALVFGGGTSASSFGSNYDTSSVGGRAALVLTPTPLSRVQFDLQGASNGTYCPSCGNSSYVAGGAHVGMAIGPGTEAGLFGGFERVNPTFFAPSSTDGFVGLETRHFFKGWMVGGQAGYFDVTSGPGTLTNAKFVEGRVKIALGDVFGYPALRGVGLGGTVGYASGNLGSTSIGANSFYWTTMLSYQPSAAPVSVFVDYTGFTNRTDTLGTVWTEQMVKGGIKIGFGNPTNTLEPTTPLPVLLRTVAKF